MMRQGANQAVRFSTYSTLKQEFQKYSGPPGQPLPALVTFWHRFNSWYSNRLLYYAFRCHQD